jgi:uncharacterized membrane protein
MSDLVVLAFNDLDGAAQFGAKIKDMQRMEILKLEDAAVVTRGLDGKAKVKQANNLVGAGAFGGAFWGMLIGLLFFMPWLGMAVGAISGALAGKFTDIGIDDEFIKATSREIAPGTSALFLMVAGSTPDRVLEELRGYPDVHVLKTSLSREAEDRLREAMASPTREESEAEATEQRAA